MGIRLPRRVDEKRSRLDLDLGPILNRVAERYLNVHRQSRTLSENAVKEFEERLALEDLGPGSRASLNITVGFHLARIRACDLELAAWELALTEPTASRLRRAQLARVLELPDSHAGVAWPDAVYLNPVLWADLVRVGAHTDYRHLETVLSFKVRGVDTLLQGSPDAGLDQDGLHITGDRLPVLALWVPDVDLAPEGRLLYESLRRDGIAMGVASATAKQASEDALGIQNLTRSQPEAGSTTPIQKPGMRGF